MATSCLFCDKLAKHTGPPSADPDWVWSFRHSTAWLGPWQYYHGYCLLVAHEHVTELFHLNESVRLALMSEMVHLAQAIAEEFHPRKMNYELLGNQVPHVHWHLFPRYEDDPWALKPVWLRIEQGETSPDRKRELEGDPRDRADTVQRLHYRLSLTMGDRA